MAAQTYRLVDLAVEQLAVAIPLFLERRNYAAVITLAGAAEAGLGQELKRRGQRAVLDWRFDHLNVVSGLLDGKTLDHEAFTGAHPHCGSAIRRANGKDEPRIKANLEDVASWMQVRACENARRLGMHVENAEAFDHW